MSKTILITGANRGIGKEISTQLLSLGYRIIATARNLNNLELVFGSPTQNLHFYYIDVTNESSIENAANKIEQKFKKIDVLINNAGVGVGNSGMANPNIEEIRQIMETNFFGPLMVVKHFLPLLKNSYDGRIINISSGMGAFEGLYGGYAGYRLSKAGLNTQTILLANELKGTNISVNAICPGWVKTDMGGLNAPRPVAEGADTAVWLATAPNIPTGKLFRDRQIINW